MTDSATKHAAAHARYMSVRHLDARAAAAALNINVYSVYAYRRAYPSTAPDTVAQPLPPAESAKPATIKHIIPMMEPSRSSAAGSVRLMLVTLAAPPWGGGFERHGVKA